MPGDGKMTLVPNVTFAVINPTSELISCCCVIWEVTPDATATARSPVATVVTAGNWDIFASAINQSSIPEPFSCNILKPVSCSRWLPVTGLSFFFTISLNKASTNSPHTPGDRQR